MANILTDYYRLPIEPEQPTTARDSAAPVGFFRFGPDILCYGQCESGVSPDIGGADRYDASKDVRIIGPEVHLPFAIDQIVDNLRMERYTKTSVPTRNRLVHGALIRKAYYTVREMLPVSVRRHLQRFYFKDWKELRFPNWPVDFTVDLLHAEYLRLFMKANGLQRVPFIWFWPEGASNCLILTHDVETSAGRDFTPTLMDMDDAYGLKSSFQVVPENRYPVPDDYLNEIRMRGFECNVHDLNHDGNLYQEREQFLRRAKKINEYVLKYDARGFRAGAMNRNEDWYDMFEFSFDMSVPNVAHLEPQRGGCCTVMPYFIGRILELPLTACQDYSLFHILNSYSTDLWKVQLDLLRKHNGLMSFITHPDYLIEKRARATYEKLLGHLQQMVVNQNVWAALPTDVDRWWRARSQMTLVRRGSDWEIAGPEKERAQIAYAVLDGDSVLYERPSVSEGKSVRT